jgi:hypothetical protein
MPCHESQPLDLKTLTSQAAPELLAPRTWYHSKGIQLFTQISIQKQIVMLKNKGNDW